MLTPFIQFIIRNLGLSDFCNIYTQRFFQSFPFQDSKCLKNNPLVLLIFNFIFVNLSKSL